MSIRISAPGVGLPPPQYLYPSELFNAPNDLGNNEQTLAPGDAIQLPAGDLMISLGNYSILEFLDPVSGGWRADPRTVAHRGGFMKIFSDGFTQRLRNPLGTPITARVDNGGTGYTQSTATITASAGSSTWQPVVGGQLSIISVANAGANYVLQPLVFVPAPPTPGVQAAAVANISAGTVTGVTLTDVGAGYTSIPPIQLLPSPYDPNLATITQAVVSIGTVNSGKITAAICTNPGAPGSSAPTLTVGGGTGTTATLTAILLQTATGASIRSAGTGYDSSSEISSVGGVPAAGVYTQPTFEYVAFRPRKASIGATITGGTFAAIGTVYDGGMFCSTVAPGALVTTNSLPTTGASITLTLGTANDLVFVQPV